jgi:hypothetical protein
MACQRLPGGNKLKEKNMGLDITAYRKLTKLDVVFDADGEPIDPQTREPVDDYMKVYANSDFPGRAEGLEDRAIYSYEEADSCLSLGYGGYNGWREALAKMAGYPLTEYEGQFGSREKAHAAACWGDGETGPFAELINFTDCDGTIGPVVAAKLARDFAEWDERAKAVGEPHYFYRIYAELRKGVEMAADGGALRFH